MKTENVCSEIVDKYIENYKLQITLDKELYELKPREEWIANFQKRAERMQKIFADNQYLLERLQSLLKMMISASAQLTAGFSGTSQEARFTPPMFPMFREPCCLI